MSTRHDATCVPVKGSINSPNKNIIENKKLDDTEATVP